MYQEHFVCLSVYSLSISEFRCWWEHCDDPVSKSMSTSGRDRVLMSCKASHNVGIYVSWYQQEPGKSPKLLLYWASNRYTGVPDHFIGSGSGTDFILTISMSQAKDLADYCQQLYDTPLTVLLPPTQTSLRASPAACTTHSPGLYTA